MHTKALSRVQIKDADQGLVTAIFSTFDVIDSDGDVTRKGAFTDGAPVVISAYGHQSWDGALPVGKGVIREEDEHAILEGQFFVDTIHGLDTFNTVKHLSADDLQEWSYSLENVTSERGEFAGKQVRFINSVKVKEVSPVLRGAGPSTRTLDIKSGDLKFSDHKDAVLTAVDEVTARALEVVTLRIEQGKAYPSVLELHQQLQARADALKAHLDALTTPPSDELAREFARFVAISQGVTTR